MDNLTIVIPYYEEKALLDRLLASIPDSIPTLVIDDQSSTALVLERPNTIVFRPPTKRYFTGAVNVGIDLCSTDVLVLNQDITLTGTAWQDLIVSKRGKYALFGERIKGNHPAYPFGYVHGVFQFMRRDAIKAAGPMDESLYPLWGASALWQLTVCRKGFEVRPFEFIPGLMHEPRQPGARYGSSIIKLLEVETDKKSIFIRTPPIISVIIPCYNHGKYLQDAISSLIGGPSMLGPLTGQTFQSFEIIIVDDGSTADTTREILRLVDGWKGVRYIRQANGGTASANNTGIRAAIGQYVTIMGADDMREAWSLQDLYTAILANPGKYVYDAPTPMGFGAKGITYSLPPYDCAVLPMRNMVPAGILFPKIAWAEAGGYPESMRWGREDWAFNIALALKGWHGHKIERSGYLYRREGQNRTIHNNEMRSKFLSQLVEMFPEAYEENSMCCGQTTPKRNSTVKAGGQAMRSFKAAAIPQAGMLLVTYVGRNMGNETWAGPGSVPSGHYYVFGANDRDRTKFVDPRDVHWLLNQRENGKPIFKLVEDQGNKIKPITLPIDNNGDDTPGAENPEDGMAGASEKTSVLGTPEPTEVIAHSTAQALAEPKPPVKKQADYTIPKKFRGKKTTNA